MTSECDITRRSHVFFLYFFIAIINHEAGAPTSVFYPIVGKVKEQKGDSHYQSLFVASTAVKIHHLSRH
jgi:hypothetical protein